jgi:hypothetical protein
MSAVTATIRLAVAIVLLGVAFACGNPQAVKESNPVGVNAASGDVLLRAVRVARPRPRRTRKRRMPVSGSHSSTKDPVRTL